MVLPGVLTAYRSLSPNKTLQGWLNMSEDKFLFVTIREWSA